MEPHHDQKHEQSGEGGGAGEQADGDENAAEELGACQQRRPEGAGMAAPKGLVIFCEPWLLLELSVVADMAVSSVAPVRNARLGRTQKTPPKRGFPGDAHVETRVREAA
jgi:hypothetical protein